MAKLTEPIVKDLDAFKGMVPGLDVNTVSFSPDTYGADTCFKVHFSTNRSEIDVGWVKPSGKRGMWLIQTPWIGGPLGWSIKGVTILSACKRLLSVAARQRIS